MQLYIRLHFGKVEIVGAKKIPVGKPIIYSCNHQNAFMDALLVGAISPVRITSMTRSDVFNTPFRWFMDALQMLPIYRMRDGIDKLGLNDEIFKKIRNLFRNDQAILIFSEGNHGNEYFLRPLSKGSSRMALESMDELPEKDIQIVPVGLNYLHHQRPLHKLTIVFGDPIPVRAFYAAYKEHNVKGANQLKEAISAGMEKCLWIGSEREDYLQQKQKINRLNEHIDFVTFKNELESNSALPILPPKNVGLEKAARVLGLLNFLPIMLLSKVLMPIRDIVFYGSVKYAFGLFIFPIWWLLVFVLLSFAFHTQLALCVLLIQIVALFVRQWLIKIANQPH